MYSQKINDAFVLAADYHRDKLRKGENHPYIIHPFEVFIACYDMGCEEDTLIAAILHDVIEDTPCSEEEIQSKFGNNVLKIVMGNTETDKSQSWDTRKQHTIDTLAQRNQEELKMFLADKYVNLKSFINAYDIKGDRAWEAFRAGKDKQKWYHEEIYKTLDKLMDKNEKTEEYLKAFNEGCAYLFGK